MNVASVEMLPVSNSNFQYARHGHSTCSTRTNKFIRTVISFSGRALRRVGTTRPAGNCCAAPIIWLFKVFCGRRGATRDHEPRRGEGSALPVRRRLAATRLETSSFARCATEDESSRRWRRVHAAHSGSFAAPGHERRLRGTRKYTKSPSSPSPRKACSRGDGTRRLR